MNFLHFMFQLLSIQQNSLFASAHTAWVDINFIILYTYMNAPKMVSYRDSPTISQISKSTTRYNLN